MLKLQDGWLFESPGEIASGVIGAFSDLIHRISGQGHGWAVLECFKSQFAGAAGVPHHTSSSESWAATDLQNLMHQAASNAPLFINAFFTGCVFIRTQYPEIRVPDATVINRLLTQHGAGYQIREDELVAMRAHAPVQVVERPLSLDSQAQELIAAALDGSERALAQQNGRQAVQELLWLLETVATAFRGTPTSEGTVQARYFNKIIAELRANRRGSHQDQILNWVMTLHGFLSSPTGGGIRHGLDLAEGIALQINEARLYCNLIRSYVNYLIAEHERLQR